MHAIIGIGKYGAFIWPAYGISAIGIIGAVALTMLAYYRAKRQSPK
ncbi:MAG: heme exporter protein CcmD [Alphaproteobacteria bacterium]|nr:heme exporter protein CcmD [Alphaproteobacteria bacterium]